MFVCLCTGATSHAVHEVVANGARTSRDITEACGAGGDCGRCRRTLRAIIEAHYGQVSLFARSDSGVRDRWDGQQGDLVDNGCKLGIHIEP